MDELSFRCEKENINLIFPSAKHMHKLLFILYIASDFIKDFNFQCSAMKLKISFLILSSHKRK